MEQLRNELKKLNINLDSLCPDIIENAIAHGYKVVNNHFMAYVDNNKIWWVDQWVNRD